MDEKKNILSIKDLSVHYFTVDMGECHAVNHVSFDLGEGETLGCYMLRGRSDDCYVSITDEEAKMEPPGQPPEQ